MKKFIFPLLLFISAEIAAQPELATPEEVSAYFQALREVESAFENDPSGALHQYYNRSDIFVFRGKDMLNDSVMLKDLLLRSYSRPVRALTGNYRRLRIYMSSDQVGASSVALIARIQRSNDSIYRKTMIGTIGITSPLLRSCLFAFEIIDSNSVAISNAGCYLLTKSKCRDLLCADCKKTYTDNCDAVFMEKLKGADFWDPVNRTPVKLFYGDYIYYIVANGKILKKDILKVSPDNSSVSNTNIQKIQIGSND